MVDVLWGSGAVVLGWVGGWGKGEQLLLVQQCSGPNQSNRHTTPEPSSAHPAPAGSPAAALAECSPNAPRPTSAQTWEGGELGGISCFVCARGSGDVHCTF